jgi:hypothetical protein
MVGEVKYIILTPDEGYVKNTLENTFDINEAKRFNKKNLAFNFRSAMLDINSKIIEIEE